MTSRRKRSRPDKRADWLQRRDSGDDHFPDVGQMPGQDEYLCERAWEQYEAEQQGAQG